MSSHLNSLLTFPPGGYSTVDEIYHKAYNFPGYACGLRDVLTTLAEWHNARQGAATSVEQTDVQGAQHLAILEALVLFNLAKAQEHKAMIEFAGRAQHAGERFIETEIGRSHGRLVMKRHAALVALIRQYS